MSFQIEIIRAAEFIRIGAEGQFDLPASKAALRTLAAACRKRGIDTAVLDLRALQPGPKPVFTTSDLLELVNTFPQVGFTKNLRLAILYRSDPHKRARLFAFLGTLHGWNVQAFADYEHALKWLSNVREEAHPELAGKPVPIRDKRRISAGRRQAGSPGRSSDLPLPRRKTASASRQAVAPPC